MAIGTKKTVSQNTGPTLQLKKPLLPIDEYAAREGVSRGIIEKCGKLGIVQIRKYKGKTFVVDTPLSPYRYAPETTKNNTQPIDKNTQAKMISELARKVTPCESETPHRPTESDNLAVKAAQTSALVRKLLSKAFKITDEPEEASNETTKQAENIPERVQMVPPEPPKTVTELEAAEIKCIQNELNKSRAELKAVRNEVIQARQSFKTIQQRNCEAVNRLNERFRKLTVRLNELTGNR